MRAVKPRPSMRPGPHDLCGMRDLGLLDGRKPPGIGSDGPHEGPELLELHGLGAAAVDDLPRALVHRVVEQVRQEVHRHVVLAALLPGLGDGDRSHGDVLEPVDPSLAAEAVAVLLEYAGHLWCEGGRCLAHVPRHPRRLDAEEDVRGGVAEARGVEARVHLTDVAHAALEVARARIHGLRLVHLRLWLGLSLASAIALAIARHGRGLAASHHPEEEEDTTADEQDLQEADAAAHAAAEEHAAEKPAERQAGQPTHERSAPPGTLGLLKGRRR